MSEENENAEIVRRRALEAANRRDYVELVRVSIDGLNAFMCGEMSEKAAMHMAQGLVDPQFEYHWHSGRGTFPDEPQHIRGLPALIAFWSQVRSAFVDYVWEPLELIEQRVTLAAGDELVLEQVVAQLRRDQHPAATGVLLQLDRRRTPGSEAL